MLRWLSKLFTAPKRDLTIWGHRGASGYLPENTLSSFRECLESYDADVELDLRLTKDSVVAVMHDASVDRTTDGRGNVRDLNWSYVQTLDAGGWFSERYVGEPVPSLTDALELLSLFPHRKALLDVKDSSRSMFPRIAESIASSRTDGKQIVCGCWDDDALDEAARYLPDLRTAFIGDPPPSRDFEKYKAQGVDIFHVNHSKLTSEWVDLATAADFEVWAWTVNTTKDAETALAKGAGGLCGNYPGLLTNSK